MKQRSYRPVAIFFIIVLPVLPGCAKAKRVAARSGAAVQHGTAHVGDGVEKVGDKIRTGMDKTADKLEVVGEKLDQGAKKMVEKFPE